MRNLFVLLLLAGCSTAQWTKPGATQETTDSDTRACVAAAQAVPTLPSQQTTLTASGAVVVTEPNQPIDANRQFQEGQRVDTCMRQKGYTLRAG